MAGEQAILGLTRTTLREQAIDSLRRAITTGELAPGSHVSEVDMAARLHISRGTLREAMRVLQNEGLLIATTRNRLLVRRMSAEELQHLFEVRTALEALAAQTLAVNGKREIVTSELHAALERMDAASGPPWEPRMQADLDFHRRMCELTGNETLVRAWTALEGAIQMSIAASGIERAVQNMDVNRHQEIIDAISTGNAETAIQAVRAHMATAVSVLIE